MKYTNFERHIFSDKIRWFISATAFILLAVFLAAACTQGFTNGNPWGWFDKKEEETEEARGGLVLSDEVQEKGISLMSAVIPIERYALYGVSPTAESAYMLTATIMPANADKTVDWSVEFVNPSALWAVGKTASSYVTVTPTSDGALTATIQCLQPFDEQLKVVVTSRVRSFVKAECTCDYVSRITAMTYSLSDGTAIEAGNMTIPFDENVGFNSVGYWKNTRVSCSTTEGTFDDTFVFTFTARYSDAYISAWQSNSISEEWGDLCCEFDPVVYGLRYGRWLGSEIDGTGDLLGSINFMNDSLYADYIEILKTCSNNFLEVTITATGEYSSYTMTTIFSYDINSLNSLPTDASLNASSYIF